VGSALADAVGERFETLADSYHQCGRNGGAIDPVTVEVLGLETRMRRDLKEVRCEHRIFVGPHALILTRGGEGRCVWVFDDFQFVLLVSVEKAIEGRGWEVEGFGYEGGEFGGDARHVGDVGFVSLAEGGEI